MFPATNGRHVNLLNRTQGAGSPHDLASSLPMVTDESGHGGGETVLCVECITTGMANQSTQTPAIDAADSDPERAERVVVSYPADLSSWGRFQVEKPSFRAYLRKVHDEAREGDAWEEFVGVGCCGNSLDVPLQVERVDGGALIDENSEIEYTVREACDLQGSWAVQSAGGPTHSGTATDESN